MGGVQLTPRRVWFSGGGRRGGGGPKDCSTEGAGLQLNVWDDNTRRDIVEDGITGCVAHTVDAARRVMADPASRKILLAGLAPAARHAHWSATLPYEARDLNLTDPTKGYLNFVLYTEPQRGAASSSLNAELDINGSVGSW